jgi:tetratricopeptide (TPR) repeat protein
VSAQAAAAIADMSTSEVDAAFDVLIDGHLVDEHGTDQYGIHDLLHMYASERVETDESAENRNMAVYRMVDWYLATMTNATIKIEPLAARVPPVPHGARVASTTFDTAAKALAWCLWERTNILAVARRAEDYGYLDHLWRLIGEFFDVAVRTGDPRDLIGITRSALAAAMATGSREGEAGHLNALGVLDFKLGRYESAARLLDESRGIFEQLGNLPFVATLHCNIGDCYLQLGRLNPAVDRTEQSLDIWMRIGDEGGQARAYRQLGDANLRLSRRDNARKFYEKSLALARQAADGRCEASALIGLGELDLVEGEFANAIVRSDRARAIADLAHDDCQVAEALRIRAAASYKLHSFDDALAVAREAVDKARRAGDGHGHAHGLDILAHVHHAIGNVDAARQHWTSALGIVVATGDPLVERVQQSLSQFDLRDPAVPEPTIPLDSSAVRVARSNGAKGRFRGR